MLAVLTVVFFGLAIGWWTADAVRGYRAYLLAAPMALVAIPLAGIGAAYLQALMFGGRGADGAGLALGLGLAVALIEVPLLIFRRQRRLARTPANAAEVEH